MTDTGSAFEGWVKHYSTLPTERDEHGYTDMTVEIMLAAWKSGLAHGRAEAANAATETVRATTIVAGEPPEQLVSAIAMRVANVGKTTHWMDGLCAFQPPKGKDSIQGAQQ